jgi:protein-tyrosine-phosphatase
MRHNVLFVCTGNSARSIIAEACINHLAIGQGKFTGYSAGSHPKGAVHPLALDVLKRSGVSIDGLRSKSWDEFAAPGAPQMNFIFTVCDNAAGEQCPYWPGKPVTAHWGVPDPAAVQGSEADQRHAFTHMEYVPDVVFKPFPCLPEDWRLQLPQQHDVQHRVVCD